MSNAQNFNASSTTDEVLADVDLSSTTAVVTGASAGLGEETVRALASKGAKVFMVARQADKLQAAAERVRSQVTGAQLEVVAIDLADLASVRAGAKAINNNIDQLELLINNAGLMACDFSTTAEGCELQFATNHIGHFLLTMLLAPALIAAKAARVVNLSSGGHKASPVDFDDLHYQHKAYDKWQAYGQAKTANVLFTVALAKRLADKGVQSFAIHPGSIVTKLGRHLNADDIKEMTAEAKKAGTHIRYKTIPQGAATSVWAATSPALNNKTALYLEDCHVAPLAQEGIDGGYMAYAIDDNEAEKLWQVSESIVAEKFDFI